MSLPLIYIYILLLKGMSVGFQTVLIAHAVKHLSHSLSGRLYIGILAGYVGYSLIAFTSVSSELGLLLLVSVFFSSISPMFFWLLINSLYQESFKVNPLYWLVLLFVSVSSTVGGVVYQVGVTVPASPDNLMHWPLFYLPAGINTVLLILGLHSILNNWRTDLVEARRWLWMTVIPSIGIIMLIPLLVIVLRGNYILPIWMEAVQATYVFLIFFVVVSWLLDGDLRHLLETKAKSWMEWLGWEGSLGVAKEEPQNNSAGNETNHQENSKLLELEKLMTEEKSFKRQKLTVNDLAQLLDMPEHQLRNLINRNLGYRNFNDFVNHYRIMHVVEALKKTESKRLPLMTLALDSGFNSIAPFNRAFKEKMGVAPNEYRTKLNNAAEKSKK